MSIGFPTLIGGFIHNCGALELFINNTIRAFATDSLLSANLIKSPLYKRIVLLRQLLHDRSCIGKEVIDSLCNELEEIRKQRNIVAHNPFVSTEPNGTGTEEILVLRYKPVGVDSPDKLTKEDVARLVTKTKDLMIKFTKLIPEATKT